MGFAYIGHGNIPKHRDDCTGLEYSYIILGPDADTIFESCWGGDGEHGGAGNHCGGGGVPRTSPRVVQGREHQTERAKGGERERERVRERERERERQRER